MGWNGVAAAPPCFFVCAFVQDVVVLMWLGRRRKEEQGGAGSDNKCFCPSLCFLEKPCFCHFFQNNKPHKLEAVASITPSEGRSNKAKKKIDLQSSEAQQCVDKAWLASLFAFSSVSTLQACPPPTFKPQTTKSCWTRQNKSNTKQRENKKKANTPNPNPPRMQECPRTHAKPKAGKWKVVGGKKKARVLAL